MLAKGQGRYAEKAEAAVESFFFKKVEIDAEEEKVETK